MNYFAVEVPEGLQRVIARDNTLAAACISHTRKFDKAGWHESIELMDNPDSSLAGPSDVLVILRTVVIVSDAARKVLASVLETTEVEWLRASYRGERWWFMHGLTLLDALDEERSQVRRGQSSGHVMAVGRLRVIPEKCKGHALFRLSRGLETWVYIVSSDFVDAWNNAGLRGFEFIPLGGD